MAVAVDEGVQTGGIGDQSLAGVGQGSYVVAQMAQSDDHVGFLGSGVDGFLNVGIHCFAGGDAVDVLALLILEVGGGGLGEGLGSGDAHEGDLHAVDLKDLVSVQHALAGHAVSLIVEVCGDVGKLGPNVGGVDAAVLAVVKLVVAQSGHVIVGGVHQLNDGFTLIHGAISGALDMVAGIDQKDVLIAVLESGHLGVGDVLVDVGVDVVGVEDDDFIGCGGGSDEENIVRGCHGRHSQRKDHDQRKQQREKFVALQCVSSFLFFIFALGVHDNHILSKWGQDYNR